MKTNGAPHNSKNLNHIPVPRAFKEKLREQVLQKLVRKALAMAEKEKAKLEGLPEGAQLALTEKEAMEVADKLRHELQKRGFFDL